MRRLIKLLSLVISILIMPISLLAEEPAVQEFDHGSLKDIRTQLKDQPFVMIFWSKDCAYCFKEMRMLGRLQPKHPELNVVLVSTDAGLDHEMVKHFSKKTGIKPDKTLVFSETSQGLYSYVDRDWNGELPHTFFHNSKHEYQSILGEVKYKQIKSWLRYIRTEDS